VWLPSRSTRAAARKRGTACGSAQSNVTERVLAMARMTALIARPCPQEDRAMGRHSALTGVSRAAVSPREEYPRLNNGRDTAPVDDQEGVWVLPCLFVVEEHRRKGVTAALVDAAVELARSMGASAIEAVPGDPVTLERTPSASYTGTVGLFGAAGFAEVARRTAKGRVVMRRDLRTDLYGTRRGHA